MDTRGPIEQLDDHALVDLINAGGTPDAPAERAFTALYHRHRDFVLRTARRFAADDAQALDAMQETFLYLLRKFPPPPENRLALTAKLTTLLYPAAKHSAIRAKEKSARLRLVGDELPDPPDPTPAPTADDSLDALLGHLSPDHREAVLLRFVDGLTVPEIAQRLGVPAGTVKSRLHHAVARLREDPATQKFFEA